MSMMPLFPSPLKKKPLPHRETIPQIFRPRTPSRFPSLALPRSGSTGMISGFLQSHPVCGLYLGSAVQWFTVQRLGEKKVP
jgi:hypothetical protein